MGNRWDFPANIMQIFSLPLTDDTSAIRSGQQNLSEGLVSVQGVGEGHSRE